jgi:phosphonate degradation associated HDIG domain protein
MDVIQRIETLFLTHGHTLYEGRRAEGVTALQHALQCAQLAEWAGSPATLIAAALLHDVGHFVGSDDDDIDDAHEQRALGLLSLDFGRAVLEPIRLHVEAKRYLVAVHPQYASKLSAASQHSLALQGGPMNIEERRWFERLPYAEEAVSLRRFDDAAKTPGQRTPPLAYYLALLAPMRMQHATAEALELGPD